MKRFWNYSSKQTMQIYAVLYFTHLSLKRLVCMICCIQLAFIVFVNFCFSKNIKIIQ